MVHFNTGIIRSQEFKDKIRKTMTGRKYSEERKKNISKGHLGQIVWNKDKKTGQIPWNKGIKSGVVPWNNSNRHRICRGEKSPLWKGGITPGNQKIRHSLEYKLWREAVFKRDNWTCIWCRKRGVSINADHIKPFALFPGLRFAIDNGRTLCVKCHRKTDSYGSKKVIQLELIA